MAASSSSFGRWLDRAGRKGDRHTRNGNGKGSGGGDDYGGYRSELHIDPRVDAGLSLMSRPGPSCPTAATPSVSELYPSPRRQRLRELEGFLFSQNYYRHLHPSSPSVGGVDAFENPEQYDGVYVAAPPQLTQQWPQTPPTYRLLHLPAGEAEFSSVVDGGTGVSTFGAPVTLNHEPFGTPSILAGSTEAERYIACLEEEVQALMTENEVKGRLAVAALAARDTTALALEELRQRREMEQDERAAVQTITCSFLRTMLFHRLLEERSRAMELNTQISILKHELKLAEMMREQTQQAASTTAASAAATQELQRKVEEQQLAQSVTTAVRGLLQQECTRLAELMAQMPHRMQCLLDEQQLQAKVASAAESVSAREGSPTPAPPPFMTDTTQNAEQRRLCALLESALAAVSARQESDVLMQHTKGKEVGSSSSGGDEVAAGAAVPHPVNALSVADSARFLSLIRRAQEYQETVLDMYCDAVDAKSSLVQYEMSIVRLIYEKQSSLTWATLYEEKKDEVRHLNEKLMEMRGELRAVTNSAATGGCSQRGMQHHVNGNSFAGSTSLQSYEAYAAPYVPLKKKPTQKYSDWFGGGGGAGTTSSQAQAQPARTPATTKPIAELREEARRLGAHPAVHYPLPVTSPSPSMPSLYVSRTPLEVEQTMLKRRSPDHDASPPTTPERQSTPQMKSPVAALIRSFAPRSSSGSRSSSSSSSSSLSVVVPTNTSSKKVNTSVLSPSSAAQKAQGVGKGSGRGTRTADDTHAAVTKAKEKEKGERTKGKGKGKAPAHVPSTSSTSSTSSSTSVRSDDLSATPIPASRGPTRQVSAPQRITTTATSSSLSSGDAALATKFAVGAAASASDAGPAATPKPVAPAVHNSFDDDNNSDDEVQVLAKKAAAAAKKQTQLPTTKALAVNAPIAKTRASPSAVQIKKTSLDETVKVMEKAKQGNDDDDTSSLSLTTTSSASVRPHSARQQQTTKASPTAVATKTIANQGKATTLTTKPTAARRSSFDDDDGDGGADDSDAHDSLMSTPPVSSLKVTPPVEKSTGPSLSLASAKSKPEPAAVSTAATSKQPHKLKLPSW
jgi:hypothetical protein